ncbi:MAG TPA: carboxylesterase family protein, partial [Acidimicrobiia bacterium]|nr:carboxylesterase family protein [Acidimicrobiia bacterium]
VRESTSGDDFLTGKGFGPNLAFLQGIESSPEGPLRSPHNAVMTVLARGGIPFTMLWLLTVGLCAREALLARRLARRHLSEWGSITAMGAILFAAIVGGFVNGLFDVYLEGPTGGIWFWASCGAAVGLARTTRPDRLPRDAPVVTTVAGPVAGTLLRAPDGTVLRRFLGIPYAAPPVGDLRWRAPRPPEPWAGTRAALEFAPAAPQGVARESRLPGFRPDHITDEDCLALNVWTPGLHGARPVLVWFPGGAYLNGGTAQPVYDASRLAAEANAVVVTVGYRLGALGFLDPEGDGVANCGLRDQLAALDWIRDHATAFGGNPMKVTIMGESAGAGSVLHLLASPRVEAVPTFQRAIVQSGQPSTLTEAQARAVADAFARHLGIDRADADTLRAIPVDRLLEAQAATSAEMLAAVGPMAFAPVIDDDVCDGTIVDAMARGRATDIDLVIGTTRDELALFATSDGIGFDDARLLRRLGRLLGDTRDAERALADYRQRLPATATNTEIWNAATTDVMMRAPALRVADAHAIAGGRTFVYRFDWTAPGLGAAHGVDLPFTFGTADREGWDTVVGWDRRAEALGREWRACWSFFAATGDPSTPLRRWPVHDPDDPTVMVFAPGGTRVVAGLDASLTRS